MSPRRFAYALPLLLPLAVAATTAVGDQVKLAKRHQLTAQKQTFGSLSAQIGTASGVEFVIPETIRRERVSGHFAANTWYDLARQVFEGFSYVAQANKDGRLRKFVVTGRLRDGTVSPEETERNLVDLFTAAPRTEPPESVKTLPPYTYDAIRLNRQRLERLQIGERAKLRVANREYAVVHDNRFAHANGDLTWIGYLANEGKEYRVALTMGRSGSVGQIATPDGLFRIDTAAGGDWLVDVAAAGLTTPPFVNDEQKPAATTPLTEHAAADVYVTSTRTGSTTVNGVTVTTTTVTTTNRTTGRTTVTTTRSSGPTGTTGTPVPTPIPVSNTPTPTPPTTAGPPESGTTGNTAVDVMVFYTAGMIARPIATRLNYLTALTNQAYIDSGINVSLRLVYSQQVDYTETNSNLAALGDLSNGSGPFANTEFLRSQYGADLVALLRPFKRDLQGGCGVGWVNGAMGQPLSSRAAYSVVGDGSDGSAYCTDYAFAHELGHNMGSSHDREHSQFQGRFPYSYGYGRDGVYGTIMSYYTPQVGIFSSPAAALQSLYCKGNPCGVTGQADNVQSINQTAPYVGALKPRRD